MTRRSLAPHGMWVATLEYIVASKKKRPKGEGVGGMARYAWAINKINKINLIIK